MWGTKIYRIHGADDGIHSKVEMYEDNQWININAGYGFWERIVDGITVQIDEKEAFIEIL